MSLAARLCWTMLYLAAALSCAFESGWLARPVAPDLNALPGRLGALEILEPLPFDLAALGENPPEAHAFLSVRDAEGREGRLFLAYYARSKRWSGRPHDLEGCYAAAGWQERESRRLATPPHPWSRRFQRADQGLHVVHWIEHPGTEVPGLDGRSLLTRLLQGRGLRPDVLSVYFEFPLEQDPGADVLGAAAGALSAALEECW